jgi:glycosyltransferase involved in cell wall biosynthesis
VVQFLECVRLAGWQSSIVYYDRQPLDVRAPRQGTNSPAVRVVAPDPDTWCSAALCRTVAEVVARERVDVVVARYTYLAPCLDAARAAGAAVCALDADNAFSLREGAFLNQRIPCDGYRCSPVEEARALHRADLVIAVQRSEAEYFSSLAPNRPVVVLGYASTRQRLANSASRDLLFVGSDYLPNAIGIGRFIAGPWRQIRERAGDVRLRIAGSVGQRVPGGIPAVELLGTVDDLDSVYAAAGVVINPVPVGTGVCIKSAEALAHGKCLVSTEAGVRGLEHLSGCALVVPSVEDMAGPVADLLADPARIAALEESAWRRAVPTFHPRYAFGQVEAAVYAALEAVVSPLPEPTRP